MGSASRTIRYQKCYLRSWGYIPIYQCVSKGKLLSVTHTMWCEMSHPPWAQVAEIMLWIPLVHTQTDQGMSTATDSLDQHSLTPALKYPLHGARDLCPHMETFPTM